MRKYIFGFFIFFVLLVPGLSFATTSSPLGSIRIDVPVFQAPRMLSCSVEASLKRVNLLNEVTYKIQYSSNYSQLNTQYTVYGNGDGLPLDQPLYQSAGAVSFQSGTGFLSLHGNLENTFSFPIKNNPGITLRASVNGIQCASKYLKTIPAAILPIGQTIDLSDIQINTSSLLATSSLFIPIQNHTCKMLVEAAALDSDSILIGGVISSNNLKAGQYPYTVRGYRSDSVEVLTKYTGIYNAKTNTESTLVFGQEGKAFLFTYDSKNSKDSYIINATLGNVDCSAVIFPSRLSAVNQNSESPVAGGSVNTSSSLGGNIGENGETKNNDSDLTEKTTGENGIVALGLSQQDRLQGEDLQLLVNTGNTTALSVAPKTDSYEGDSIQTWSSRNSYIIIGLLAALLVSMISYIVLKYRGLM